MRAMVDMEEAGRVMPGVGVEEEDHGIPGVDEEGFGLHSPALEVGLTWAFAKEILCF